ncbi:MAG TPA: peptidoglycan-binding domain-containing protein [Acidimicrobiales bacterium]|nr:peptidoglycan-binding domain-containing protein [Acidimicrobiales bacterium]
MLGARLLFLRTPPLRGDDVADLQVRLAQLGFNPGRIDGIFGPLLDQALREFQENSGLDVSGTLTRATVHELERLGGSDERRLVTDARSVEDEDEFVSEVVVWGQGPLVRPLIEELRRVCVVHAPLSSNADEVASFANERRVALVLSLSTLDSISGIHLHYWAGYRTHSRRGEQLASTVAASLAASEHAPRVEVTGMALPVLRETQMTTLHVESGDVPDQECHATVTAIVACVARVIHRTREK